MAFDINDIILDDWLLIDSDLKSSISGSYKAEIIDILLDDWKELVKNESDIDSEIFPNNKILEFQNIIEDFNKNILLLSLSDKFSQEEMDDFLKEKWIESNYVDLLYNHIYNTLNTANYFNENVIAYSKGNINLFFILLRIQLITRWKADLIELISDKILEIDSFFESSDFKNYSKFMLYG